MVQGIPTRGLRGVPPALLGCLVAGIALAGCLYDASEVCGPHQLVSPAGACECEEGAVLVAEQPGCTPCGEHESPSVDACVCDEGYGRSADGGPCEKLPEGLGATCDSAGAPCAYGAFSHCQAVEETAGYCTQAGCATSADCPSGYGCELGAQPTFCKRPPTGLQTPCDSSADCADFEASYCETYFSHLCLVADCTSSPDSCPEGWECCDLTAAIGTTICVLPGTCPN